MTGGLVALLGAEDTPGAVYAIAYGYLSSAIRDRQPGWAGRALAAVDAVDRRIGELHGAPACDTRPGNGRGAGR